MISLRTVTTTFVALASLALAACSDGPVAPVSKGLSPSTANFNNSGGSGSSSATATMDARVFMDKDGNAILVVHTGSYNPTTNVATPNGNFSSLSFKVYNASNKQVSTKTVSFSKTADYYWTYINPCVTNNDDDDDDDDAGKTCPTNCTTKYALNWSISVTANIKNINGGSSGKTYSVTGTAIDGYLPDVDILTQKVYVVGTGGTQTVASTVPAAAPVTYSVPFPNNKAINGVANTLAVSTTCLVFVDNVLQLAIPNIGIYNPFTRTTIYTNPNLFSYTNGSSQNINAGATGACQFSLSLPAGDHYIAVSALVTSPGDYDNSNNTTGQIKVTASSGPPDVQTLGALVQKNATTGLYETPNINSTNGSPVVTTLYQQVAQKALTNPGSVVCKVTVDGTDLSTQPAVSPALNGVASTGYCAIPVTLAVGSHTIAVTAISTPTDGDLSNNTATSTVVVANVVPVSGNLASTLSITNGGVNTSIVTTAASVLSGTSNHYSADISLSNLLGMTGLVPVTCAVSIDNHAFDANSSISFTAAGNTTTAAIVWDSPNGAITVGNGASAPCGFSLKLTESGNADVAHSITVTAKSSVLNPANPVTTTTTGLVTDLVRVDLAASAVNLVSGTALIPLASTPMGVRDTLSAVFHNPDATHSVDFTCQVTLAGSDTSFHVLTTGTVTAAPNGDAQCRWSIQPVFLQTLTFTAKAVPTASAPKDPDPLLANNSITASLGVKSTGKFTSFDIQNTFVQQEWFNLTTNASTPIEKMTTQIVQVTQLALLVVPTTDGQLGTFAMSATATNGTTTFPTGTIGGVGTAGGTLNASASGIQCIGIGPKQPYANAATLGLPSQFGYFARICTQPTTFNGVPGFQQITVDYTQSVETAELSNPVVNPGKWALVPSSNVDVAIRLDFKLANSLQSDFVQGTIRIPAGFVDGNGFGDPRIPNTYQWFLSRSGAASIVGQ